MRLIWVNHASYILEYAGIRLLSDPWIFGSAFDNGWELLCESAFSIDDFKDITHIWFSHEHPDHFAPPVLFSIDDDVRKKITVLFQKTKDGRVANFCRKLGFQVIELTNREPLQLAEGLVLTCGAVRPIDSWLLVETPTARILNLNDCIVENEAKALSIKRTVGEVDLLLTQFAYAQWVGNPDEVELRNQSKLEKLNRIKLQADAFKPKWICPFASFVYFSHQENAYLSDRVATIREAYHFVKQHTCSDSLVFYPGDKWDIATPWNSEPALGKYETDYNRPDKPLSVANEEIDISALQSLARDYIQNAYSKGNPTAIKIWKNRLARNLKERLELKIALFDSNVALTFDWQKGLSIEERNHSEPDITLSSGSLAYILQHDWGFGTVRINGRYRASMSGRRKFSMIFPFGTLHSIGKAMNLRYIITQYVFLILKKLIGRHSIETEEEPSFLGLWRQTPV
jgi:hypothetical protein